LRENGYYHLTGMFGKGLVYSTFAILHLTNNEEAEIIQYDNPRIIFLIDGENLELLSVMMDINGKKYTAQKWLYTRTTFL
jgi:hypothetical protein